VNGGELVRKITGHLKPRRQQYSLPEILNAVSEQVRFLQDVFPSFYSREAIKKTRADAKLLCADIKRIEGRIARASPELRMRLKLVMPPHQSETVSHIHPLLRELAIARQECSAAIEHATAKDRYKEWCARIAWHLVRRFSEREPGSSDNSPFRKITGLLYQVATGEADRDLKRACDNMLRAARPAGDVAAVSMVTLTMNLSEAMTVTGDAPTLTLNDGGTAIYTGGSGTSALTFSYAVAGQKIANLRVTAVNLNATTVKDRAGNAANLIGAVTFWQIDTATPVIDDEASVAH
jgi:hypothetical protein